MTYDVEPKGNHVSAQQMVRWVGFCVISESSLLWHNSLIALFSVVWDLGGCLKACQSYVYISSDLLGNDCLVLVNTVFCPFVRRVKAFPELLMYFGLFARQLTLTRSRSKIDHANGILVFWIIPVLKPIIVFMIFEIGGKTSACRF